MFVISIRNQIRKRVKQEKQKYVSEGSGLSFKSWDYAKGNAKHNKEVY